MERECPRCKSSDVGDGAYCKHCKFPVGMPRKEVPAHGTDSIAELERGRCVRCGSPVSHEPVCARCRNDMQFDKLRNQRR